VVAVASNGVMLCYMLDCVLGILSPYVMKILQHRNIVFAINFLWFCYTSIIVLLQGLRRGTQVRSSARSPSMYSKISVFATLA
jgi:hypothetical protein